jgi:hypothetical protein
MLAAALKTGDIVNLLLWRGANTNLLDNVRFKLQLGEKDLLLQN